LRVLCPLFAHLRTLVATVLLNDVVTNSPWCDGKVEEAEVLAKEEWALNLVRELLQSLVECVAPRFYSLLVLPLNGLEEVRDDLLADMVDPKPNTSALKRVGGEEVRLVIRESFLDELGDDDRLVQRTTLVLERGYETLGVDVEEVPC
jgi:hypothetical protein